MNKRCANGVYRHLRCESKCRSYDNVMILISRQEFKAWCWDETQKSAIENLIRPSLDRIDRSRGYELSNMQIVELAANIAKEKLVSSGGYSRCFVCQQWKALEEFAVDKRRQTTGRTTCCRRCDGIRKYRRRSPAVGVLLGDLSRRLFTLHEGRTLGGTGK